jgi:hypothetical protein
MYRKGGISSVSLWRSSIGFDCQLVRSGVDELLRWKTCFDHDGGDYMPLNCDHEGEGQRNSVRRSSIICF